MSMRPASLPKFVLGPGVLAWAPRLLGLALGLAIGFHGESALAYCRTTTCDADPDCEFDDQGCSLSGTPLSWGSLCLYYGVQEEGSQTRDISAATVEALMEQSFATWMDAQCGDGTPPVVVQYVGQVECHEPEFNCDPSDHNTNTVMFRDTGWTAQLYAPEALAITTVTVNVDTGEILDADMEVNSNLFSFTTSDINPHNDLLSVLTHESGHFLGLAHSSVEGSTMFAGYSSRDTSIRTLEPDDIAGICEIYPADRDDLSCQLRVPAETHCIGGSDCPDPRSGDNEDDDNTVMGPSCGMTRGPARAGHAAAIAGMALTLFFFSRRGRRARHSL